MSSLCDHGSLLSAAVHFKSRERASFLPFTQENAKLPEAMVVHTANMVWLWRRVVFHLGALRYASTEPWK